MLKRLKEFAEKLKGEMFGVQSESKGHNLHEKNKIGTLKQEKQPNAQKSYESKAEKYHKSYEQ